MSPSLKWPNDLTVNGKKLAGMLVDVSMQSNRIESLVLGVGINFNVNVKEIGKELKNTSNYYGIASLTEQKNKVTAVELVQSFLLELEKIYELLNMNQTKKIISFAYKKMKGLDCLINNASIFEKDDLSKMNVLRRIISPMGTMDGIEFLISKLKNTKNNADFFDSMNT